MARQRRTPVLPDQEKFRERVELGLAKIALRRAKRITRSSTMRRALAIRKERGGLYVGVPHYWAEHYHDGRAGISPTRARWLVYFDKPKDDPRLQGGYPVSRSQVRRLTRDEWEHGLEQNRLRREAKRRPYMIVVKRVGPTQRGLTEDPFLDEAFLHMRPEANAYVLEEFEKMTRGLRVLAQDTVRLRV